VGTGSNIRKRLPNELRDMDIAEMCFFVTPEWKCELECGSEEYDRIPVSCLPSESFVAFSPFI
jgi:hypothetical protein